MKPHVGLFCDKEYAQGLLYAVTPFYPSSLASTNNPKSLFGIGLSNILRGT